LLLLRVVSIDIGIPAVVTFGVVVLVFVVVMEDNDCGNGWDIECAAGNQYPDGGILLCGSSSNNCRRAYRFRLA
jgi:hypothetical protein